MDGVRSVYTSTNTQGRPGRHVFDLVLLPLGLAYLAAVLERGGYRVRNLDANELARKLEASERPPRVILGGPDAIAVPVECLEGHPELDALTRRSS